jgi:AraC-like DNA-binding protein
MTSVQIDGTEQDLQRFSQALPGNLGRVEVLSPFEQRLHWAAEDYSGSNNSTVLRSGIKLAASTVDWAKPWALTIEHAPSRLKFVLTRGPGPMLTTSDGDQWLLDGGMLYISQVKRPVKLTFQFGDRTNSAHHEQLALEVDRATLKELLRTEVLPSVVEEVLASERAYPMASSAMAPRLFRLLDEILYCETRGAPRQLILEAKGLELLAALVEQLSENEQATAKRLSPEDRGRIEHARQLLVVRIEEPPGLHALARAAGLNEAKLKIGFRALFGTTVYEYLRNHRMDEARRLLAERRYSVTEVALRVGYSNPSKFAAAFRKRFGMSPSDVR